jgi:hypothetical protein
MNLQITSPPSWYVWHKPSRQVRQVCALRIKPDGSYVFQFFTVIKHEGETIYGGDSSDCCDPFLS